MTSENAIHWLAQYPEATRYYQTLQQFKNKLLFRRMLLPLYPKYRFLEVKVSEFDQLAEMNCPYPCIIKPAVGFFSLGVHRVNRPEDWPVVIQRIRSDLTSINNEYPAEVVSSETFIVEEVIEGEEFAIDGYFDEHQQPVILGIYKHYFAHEEAVNDRVYMTSADIMRDNVIDIADFLDKLAAVSECKNFPFHMEIRRTPDGQFVPIELNPARFGGWCSSPDLAYLAFGINPYVAFYQQRKPDWQSILAEHDDTNYCLVVLDNSTGYAGEDIAAFDYQALADSFDEVLEVRPVDFERYSVFGFLMLKVQPDRMAQIDRILQSDLREYVTSK
jgi:hypothetical protein